MARKPKNAADAAEADARCLALNDGFAVRDSPHGRGLFATRALQKGQFITRYDGEWVHVPTLPADAVTTHMVRVPDTSWALDGLALAASMVRGPDGAWVLAGKAGFAALANAADGRHDLNAVLTFVRDDAQTDTIGLRTKGAAYLVAKRDIAAGEEIRWRYHPS